MTNGFICVYLRSSVDKSFLLLTSALCREQTFTTCCHCQFVFERIQVNSTKCFLCSEMLFNYGKVVLTRLCFFLIVYYPALAQF